MEIDEPLDGLQVDGPTLPDPLRVAALDLLHHLAGALDDPHDARLADEHVVGFLGEHELAGTGQGVEARLGQGGQLEFSVPVGEIGEHQIGKPVGSWFVERLQYPGLVGVPRMTLQQHLGLFPAVPAEVGVEQVDHGPQMAALLDVDLEQVAQVVEGGTGQT